MDPTFIAAIAVIVIGGMFLLTRPGRRSRTVRLEDVVACHLSPEAQAKTAAERNLLFQQIEEAARTRGEVGPELYGTRMAAINRMPQSVRKSGRDSPFDFE